MHTVCIREYIIILDISIMWIIVLYSRASTSLVCIICKYSTSSYSSSMHNMHMHMHMHTYESIMSIILEYLFTPT